MGTVYVSQSTVESTADQPTLSTLPDPALLRLARRIWCNYHHNHKGRGRRPLGVAIDQSTQRGHLLFRQKPILLPHEDFVPFSQIEGPEQKDQEEVTE